MSRAQTVNVVGGCGGRFGCCCGGDHVVILNGVIGRRLLNDRRRSSGFRVS